MDPLSAALLLSGVGAPLAPFTMQMNQARQQAKRVREAREQARQQGIQNQNRAVEQGFQNRRQALGLGEMMQQPTGDQASQQGTVLTSVLGNGNSILG